MTESGADNPRGSSEQSEKPKKEYMKTVPSLRTGRKRVVILVILLCGLVGALLFARVQFESLVQSIPPVVTVSDAELQANAIADGPETTNEPDEVPVAPVDPPIFESEQLQATLAEWAAGLNGNASVTVMTEDGDLLAATDKDRVYFAASIYKLYVAYFGYQQVDVSAVDKNELYLGSYTRAECLDLMIRDSHSPCAEKLWTEFGKSDLDPKLVELGTTGTTMSNIRTTSYDAAVMLARISRGEGLSIDSQTAFLESMENQIFRDALNVGFSADVTVYNKIGFNELKEYHDTAIIELADGRRFVLSVLTSGVGTKNIADLGAQIESIIL